MTLFVTFFFFAHLMYILMLLYQLFTKKTLQDKDIFICAFIFKCLGESFMALWAVYYLLYPENYLELIPNIVCMFALGVY